MASYLFADSVVHPLRADDGVTLSSAIRQTLPPSCSASQAGNF